jgi:hypothetical protein
MDGLADGLHQTTGNADFLELIDPLLSAFFLHAISDGRHHIVTVFHASRVGSQRIVVGEILQAERIRARAPLAASLPTAMTKGLSAASRSW